MSDNRKRRADLDGIKESPDSKMARFHENQMLTEIMDELRKIRAEMKENEEKNERMFEKLRMDALNSKSAQMNDSYFICETLKDIRNEMKGKTEPSIRECILGEWRMVSHENFDAYKRYVNGSFHIFSQNLKYSMENGKLKQTGGGYQDFVEGASKYGEDDLYVKGEHVKTFMCRGNTRDRYIENGKLHVNDYRDRAVWRRVYVRI